VEIEEGDIRNSYKEFITAPLQDGKRKGSKGTKDSHEEAVSSSYGLPPG
jgi:hypothetical protein